ncbi:hypothetical protein SAMN04487995_0257 [Dyadobacter koreensis]|uniref:DUF3649 domain-containing protein n=1 Tax=Dyadobacter koreensis TaxID=408657 RepID=A0A1H6QHM7_9BACT|nr:hypothetical protein [Dyadobacter koreensis]SEI38502.1 hypothetical protein SAMN04487995_0257 [Dyadobacter koreensis]
MPAKNEYLSTKRQRALKITAGLIGGYFLAVAFQMMISVLIPYRIEVILTGAFSIFMLWVVLMITAFLARSGWMIWGIYLFCFLVCSIIVFFFK